jgi:hypothetical protein
MTVVKVQRPMGPPGGPRLVYAKDRQDFDFCERSVALIAKMGNGNYRHGTRTKEAIAAVRYVKALVRFVRQLP